MVLTGIALWIFSPFINFGLKHIQPVVMDWLAKMDPKLQQFDEKLLGPGLRTGFAITYFVLRYAAMYAYPLVAPFFWLLSPIFSWIIIPIVRRFVLPDISGAKRYQQHYMPIVQRLHEQQTFQNSHSALNKFIRDVNILKDEAAATWKFTLQDRNQQQQNHQNGDNKNNNNSNAKSATDAQSFRRRLRGGLHRVEEQQQQFTSPLLPNYNAGASHANWATSGPKSPVEKAQLFAQ